MSGFAASVVVLITIPVLLWGCGDNDEPRQTSRGPADSVVITLVALESGAVLELLEKEHEVSYTSTAAGAFVTGIDSVESRSGWYWVYTVNSSMPEVSSDNCVVEAGDTVRWHFRRADW